MVRIDSGKSLRKVSLELATDEFYGEGDIMFVKYPICDDVDLQQILLGNKHVQIVKQTEASQALKNQDYRAKSKCSKCKQLGHNARTCKRKGDSDASDLMNEETESVISSSKLQSCVFTLSVGLISMDIYSDSEEISKNSIGGTSDDFCSDSIGEYFDDIDDMPYLML